MKMYEFSVIASGLDPEADDFETRFYDAGCDDATVSFQRGHIIVDFAREADTIDAAISSAVEQVLSTGAVIDRIEPDPLVSLSEIASRAGMTRAAMTQYSKGQRGKGFPAPVAKVTTESPLWDWASVALWLFRSSRAPRDIVLEAEIVKEANEALKADPATLGARLQARLRDCDARL